MLRVKLKQATKQISKKVEEETKVGDEGIDNDVICKWSSVFFPVCQKQKTCSIIAGNKLLVFCSLNTMKAITNPFPSPLPQTHSLTYPYHHGRIKRFRQEEINRLCQKTILWRTEITVGNFHFSFKSRPSIHGSF